MADVISAVNTNFPEEPNFANCHTRILVFYVKFRLLPKFTDSSDVNESFLVDGLGSCGRRRRASQHAASRDGGLRRTVESSTGEHLDQCAGDVSDVSGAEASRKATNCFHRPTEERLGEGRCR